MPGKGCGKRGRRKHTPITSEKQRGLFGAEYARRKADEEGRMKGITTKELKSHLEETKGKNLPKKARKTKKHHSANDGTFLDNLKRKFGVS